MAPADLLGPSHPLARATRRLENACLQLLSGLAFLSAIAAFGHGPSRRAELAAAIATCALLGGLVAFAWCARRQRALELILMGHEDLPLDELEPLRRRLRDPRRRRQLASSLDRCLRTAEQWQRTPPQLRPVANVRLLLPLQDDVRAIQSLLRAEALPRVRGVALCEWLLTDGPSSPLFASDGEAVRRELGRIRFALDAER